MLGVFLTILGTVFEEIGTSAGKVAVKLKVESIFSYGFISNLCATIMFAFLAVWRYPQLDISAWPTFLVRLPLELILSYLTIQAITKCSRSAFGFLRTGTIPLLLVVDAFMGYRLDGYQMLGIGLITAALLYLHMNHGLDKPGLKYAVLATIVPVATASLAKFDFNHGNSWELEQTIICAAITVFFYLVAKSKRERPFSLFKKPLVLMQACATAASSAVLTYGFLLIAPSVHMAAKRSTAVLAAVGSGGLAFHEKKLFVKAIAVAACVIGVILLVL